jgi:glycosyltransferase involved in cell wall biosynthesis
MLCYHYPPEVSGGIERSVRFVRHLPSFGWSAVVLTTARHGEGAAIGGERIERAGELFFRARGRGETDTEAEAGNGVPITGPAARWIEKWLLVPDKHIRWTHVAVWRALRLLRERRIDAVYSTSPPESSHCLALALKRLTGAPWIMDLRDPWTLEPLRWYLRTGGPRLALERRIERAAFSNADAIIVNTEEAAAEYRARYPRAADRISAIPNGWDAAGFAAARAGLADTERSRRLFSGDAGGTPQGGAFVVAHVGTFSRHADVPAYPRAFFEAVKRLVVEGAVSERNFRVVLAGAINHAAAREIDGLGLGGILDRRGSVSHAEALRIMLESDLLLLYDPAHEGRYYVRGKLYEYLAAGAWILGILPEGATRGLLERSGRGVVSAPDDGEGIRRALLRFLAERSRPRFSNGFDLDRYEGAALAASLARVLDEATARGG